ncbi:GGDEF domain-containing protein [Aliidiomarina maris]|nr:GGDEF domain-containing protein [Aliidiomarina maris]
MDKSPYKREFVQHIVTLARNLHATVIAEGIETEDELRQLQKLGIFAMQGYFIGRPEFEPFQLESLQLRIADEVAVDRFDAVSSLLEDTTVITSQRRVADILDYFKQNKRLLSIPVVDEGKVVGIVRRGHFMETMSSAFGRALFSNKPAQAIMQRNFLTIDAEAPLEKASALLTEHEDTIEHQVLLVTRQHQYAGVIPVPSLLRRITESKIQNARYANPLTLLPGNVPINQHIDQQISQEHAFCVLYFDLNYFKPFNDEYGYQQGDAVIQWFASLLERQYASLGHFVGHVGGDDFIVVVTGDDYLDAVQQELRQHFQCDVKSFYREQHIVDNFMLGRARNGRYQKFPLLDFSLAVVTVAANTAASHQDISIAAARLKSQAKRASNGVAVCHFADLILSQNSAQC